ncbi:hypothetical protein WMY93_007797 [Mugilogobius chulae]|uniref:non-specific serine/threonine protein kinase n=1 Tax=Mugilogobius chulae TaxID=88201 RepID=A0AAW0PH35_9GOBI
MDSLTGLAGYIGLTWPQGITSAEKQHITARLLHHSLLDGGQSGANVTLGAHYRTDWGMAGAVCGVSCLPHYGAPCVLCVCVCESFQHIGVPSVVAIKHIRRKSVDFVSQIMVTSSTPSPMRSCWMTKAAPDAEIGLNPSVSLLEWFSVKDEIILMLAFQLVGAMADLHSKGVFHRDLKLQNLLIECTWLGPRVRIIDFGCGAVSRPGTFSYFSGTDIYAPPEYHQEHIYSAVPTTVWQIGAVLYELLRQNEQRPFSTQGYLANRLHIPHGLSKKCSDFLQACLTEIPEDRITLDQLKDHPWLRT